jgi:hypothetical protein
VKIKSYKSTRTTVATWLLEQYMVQIILDDKNVSKHLKKPNICT